MNTADQLFGIIAADVLIGGLIIAAMILLGVFVYRVIVRTRRAVRK